MVSNEPADPQPSATGEPEATLKAGAIGFVSSMSIGLAATSPAYSLAAIIGPVVATVRPARTASIQWAKVSGSPSPSRA